MTGSPVTVVWEYIGPSDTCQMDVECIRSARWVVQEGQPTRFTLPRIRRACTEHVPDSNPE